MYVLIFSSLKRSKLGTSCILTPRFQLTLINSKNQYSEDLIIEPVSALFVFNYKFFHNSFSKMIPTKIEFAVQMTCEKCVEAIKTSLSNLKGIEDIDISLERGTVVVNTTLPHSSIQEKIESTGKKAVIIGYGGTETFGAVSVIAGNSGYSSGNESVKGVVRFVSTKEGCIIDGILDGLIPGSHGLHIHECGDISRGCESIGDHFNPYNAPHGSPDNDILKKHLGDLGNIMADNSGRARFRLINESLKVPDIIGRSLAVTERSDDLGKSNNPASKIDGNSGQRLACGIIARSSGLFQNTKKICACDGLTLWDERNRSTSPQNTEDSRK